MMSVWRGKYNFKYDGKMGTVYNEITKDMYFLNEEQTRLCCKSNINLDEIIKLIELGELLC